MKNKFILFDSGIIIEDYTYYIDNADAIDAWLEANDGERTGMVIKFDSEESKTLFVLRWG